MCKMNKEHCIQFLRVLQIQARDHNDSYLSEWIDGQVASLNQGDSTPEDMVKVLFKSFIWCK